MIKTMMYKILQMYGTEENEKKLRKEILFTILIFGIMLYFVEREVSSWVWVCRYLNCLGIAMIITLISTYFFRKKKKNNNYKKIKIFLYFFCLIITFIILLPSFMIIGLLNLFANFTNKLYVIKRNPLCFIVEIVYHIGIGLILIQQTLIHSNSIIFLFVTYSVFLIGDNLLCIFFRKIMITGKTKYYERYRYSKEMDIISEYMFLGVTVISILCSSTEYALLFIPILLWYSLKQLKKYRLKRKNANYINQYLVNVLQKLIEINDVFFETELDEKVVIKEWIDDNKSLKYYMSFNTNRKLFHFYSKRKIQNALEAINSIITKSYNISRQKKQAKEDIEIVMNNIVRCIC